MGPLMPEFQQITLVSLGTDLQTNNPDTLLTHSDDAVFSYMPERRGSGDLATLVQSMAPMGSLQVREEDPGLSFCEPTGVGDTRAARFSRVAIGNGIESTRRKFG